MEVKSISIWSCKIGLITQGSLPSGSDVPMRQAIEKAYRELTGHEADFCFSGWGAELTSGEARCVIETFHAERNERVPEDLKF